MQERKPEPGAQGALGSPQAVPGAVTFTSGTGAGGAASSLEANKDIVRRYQSAFLAGRVAELDELIAPDYVDHVQYPGHKSDKEGLEEMAAGTKSAFSGERYEQQEFFAEGDRVIQRWRMRAKHTGPEAFLGVEPTGKEVTFTGIDIFRIADGKIVEHWSEMDLLGPLQQLGAQTIPGTGPT